jgi:hypothetical protein
MRLYKYIMLIIHILGVYIFCVPKLKKLLSLEYEINTQLLNALYNAALNLLYSTNTYLSE